MKHSLLLTALAIAMPSIFSPMATMKMAEGTILDLDSLMDTEMDKVEDVPDFITPPAGNYQLKVSEAKIEKYQPKEVSGQAKKPEASRIKIFYEVEQTIETKELPVKNGSLFSESFMGTEDGIKYFKKQARNILNVDGFEGAKLRDVMDGLKGVSFKAAITIVKTPNDSGGSYENVRVRPVHEAATS